MPNIKSIKIENYRGIQELEISDLKNINILVGDNNTGKTSLLEALEIFSNPTMPTLTELVRERESFKKTYSSKDRMDILDSLYYMFNLKNPNFFKIEGIVCGKNRKVKIDVEKTKLYTMDQNLENKELDHYKYNIQINGENEIIELTKTKAQLFKVDEKDFNVYFLKTIDHLICDPFSELLKTKYIKDKAVELLKNFDENIVDIRYIPTENNYNIPMIELSNGEYLPVALYGDGLKKALSMVNAIIKARNGFLLVDEYEIALHTSIMEKVFNFMTEIAAKENVQLFLTTHSLEAVDKFLQANNNILEDIAIIRLKKKENKTYAKVMDGKEALKNREEYNLELRI